MYWTLPAVNKHLERSRARLKNAALNPAFWEMETRRWMSLFYYVVRCYYYASVKAFPLNR